MSLKVFTNPAILQSIGHIRIAKFLDSVSDDFRAANVLLPAPPDPAYPTLDSANANYFHSVAAILSAPAGLTENLLKTLLTLESAASPENDDRLREAIQRRIPCVSLAGLCPLDCALELYFLVPDELVQFVPPKSDEGGFTEPKADKAGPSIENQKSKIKNSEAPSIPQSHLTSLPLSLLLLLQDVVPWPEPVDGKLLLDELVLVLRRFVVLPMWAAETLALWILHTFAFQLRDVSTYIGIESPEPQCGKTTLLTVLNELAHRALSSANISPPAFFRVIEDLCPTLLIDEADTFLHRNDQLQGIFNSGYKRKTAFVLRVGPSGPASNGEADPESSGAAGVVTRFSCWCPKVISQIGHLPRTLADRCILIRMQRKIPNEECERLRNLDVASHQLRPYGIRPKTLWIGNTAAKGYLKEDFMDVFRRYIPESELDALRARPKPPEAQTGKNGQDSAQSSSSVP